MSIHIAAIERRSAVARALFAWAGHKQGNWLYGVALAAGWAAFAILAFASVEAELAGLAAVLSFVAVDYLQRVGRHSISEALLVGGVWLAISVGVALAMRSGSGLEALSLGVVASAAYLVAPLVVSRAVGARPGVAKQSGEPGRGTSGEADETISPPSDRGTASGPSKRPTNFVAAVLHDEAKFDQALRDLVELGIDRDSIGVLYGEAGASAMARRPRRWFHDLLSDDDQYMQRFEAEIRQGGFVIGVPLPTGRQAQREAVRDILWRHGAHAVVSRGRWTFAIDD